VDPPLDEDVELSRQERVQQEHMRWIGSCLSNARPIGIKVAKEGGSGQNGAGGRGEGGALGQGGQGGDDDDEEDEDEDDNDESVESPEVSIWSRCDHFITIVLIEFLIILRMRTWRWT